MRGERRVLRVGRATYVNRRSDELIGRSYVELRLVRSLTLGFFDALGGVRFSPFTFLLFPPFPETRHDTVGDGVEVQRRLVVQQRQRRQGYAVCLNVIGVTVKTDFVVGDDHLRALFEEDVGESLRRDIDGCLPERRGVLVLGPAHHARVAISQANQSVDPKNLDRLVEFLPSDDRHLVTVVMIIVGFGAVKGVTALAVGARDQHGAHALVSEHTIEAARGTGLIIGMCVHCEKRQLRHQKPPKRSVSSPTTGLRLQARW